MYPYLFLPPPYENTYINNTKARLDIQSLSRFLSYSLFHVCYPSVGNTNTGRRMGHGGGTGGVRNGISLAHCPHGVDSLVSKLKL